MRATEGIILSYGTLGVAVVLSLLLYRLTKTIYYVFLGPLSKVPGPRLAAATRLVYAYQRFIGNGERWLFQLHQKYGDVVRPAPHEVSFASGNNWRSICGYLPGTNRAAMVKDKKFYFQDPADMHIGVATDNDHDRHRKHLSRAFSDKALSAQEPLVQQYVDQLIFYLHRRSGEGKVDMVQSFNFTTFDIMADLTFGEPLGCLKNSKYADWVDQVFSMLPVITYVIEINHMPVLRRLIEALLPASIKRRKETHLQYTVERVNRRLASTVSRPDIMGFLQAEDMKGTENLTLDEIHANARLMMLAGTETTGTLLSGLTYYLLTNTDKLKQLTNEIRSTFTSAEEISSTSTMKLPYLACCIQEALRMYPPVPMGLPRVVGHGGIEMNGYFIPEKTVVYEHIYSVFHNANNFARANAFLPERWLKDGVSSEFVHDKRSCFQPFSVGPRNCLGMNLAYLEIRLIMTHVLYHFDMSLHTTSAEWTGQQRTFCIWEKIPLMVSLKPVAEVGTDKYAEPNASR